MNVSRLLMTALAALAAENVLFSGGIGFSRVLRAARRPQLLPAASLSVAFFSLVSGVLGVWVSRFLPQGGAQLFVRPAVLALCAAAAYTAAAFVLRAAAPGLWRRYGAVLAPAALNSVVLSIPYAAERFRFGLAETAFFALGTGASFFLASLVLSHAVARYKNDEMPRAFQGMPAVLVYIGILSLAFAGFTGGKLF